MNRYSQTRLFNSCNLTIFKLLFYQPKNPPKGCFGPVQGGTGVSPCITNHLRSSILSQLSSDPETQPFRFS